MVNWSFWTGFENNDTWSIAYHFKQKYPMSEKTALIMLGVVGVISLILLIWVIVLWRKRKKNF